ncbi:MAG: AsmA-like C-terminal domain-containing protein [Gammaproteobacteria bacterium]|nr:AsmA-like C-terminal domain-containing protein [Gammaproteobacteria bacterium]
MNDKTIIKIIKKIHFNILVFLLLLFLTGFFVFVALLEGFTISHLKLGDIKFERLYLKWDNRLTITASLIDLNELHRDNEPITLKPLSKIADRINWMQRWIASIDIKAIRYQNTEVSLHYHKNSLGTIDVRMGKIRMNGYFAITPSKFKLTLSSKNKSAAHVHGLLHLYLQEQKLNAWGSFALPNTPILKAYALGDQKKLHINIKTDQSFSTLDNLVDFFNVSPQTRPWITQYAKASRLTLHECHGSFLYDQPQKLLQSLFIRASVDDAEYTFAPKIAPIVAKKVELVFKNGVLGIYPLNGSFYTIPTQKSHLFIDFNPQHILLNAHILTNRAQLNDSILNLLRYYNITVPIRQNSGLCNVDLNLSINLNNFDTTAKGRFIPGKSELQLENFIFQTVGGIVTLDTNKVFFSGFDANYKNRLHAQVEGHYDAHIQKGSVKILPYSFSPTGDSTVLSLSTHPLKTIAIYNISPTHDTLQIVPTQWKVLNETVKVEGFTIPYDFKNASAVIPKLHFSVPDKIQGTFTGKISPQVWWLQLGLDKLNTHDLLLHTKNYALTLIADKNGVNITSNTDSFWEINGQDFSLSPLKIRAIDNKLIFDNTKVRIETFLEGSVFGEYLWKLNQGSISLTNLIPLNKTISNYINLNKNQNFSVNTIEEQLTLHSQSLGIDFTTMSQGWKITVPDISLLSNNSPLLRQYQITHGHANLFYYPKERRYTFNGIIDYPYRLMMVNGQSLSSYRFSGSYLNGKSSIRVNDRLKIDYDKSINIRANNMGINAPELARWLDIPTGEKSQESPSYVPIHLNATNTHLYLMKNRKVMADTLTATLIGNDLEARMTHGSGWADLQMRNGLYHVKGSHFNDIFMEHLFAFSDFQGGAMSFELGGYVDNFEGIMRIENTVLKEYKLLNNVLSFINTVPSLATFSLPNYNTNGLPIKEVYSHYTFRNHKFHVENFTLNSPELKINGEGNVNFKEDSIQGTLTLKSDLGSQLGRIPMVGYILFGDHGSVSTTVNLKGKLSDPVVETAIAKEIITIPFNILKRTVTYPFLWMMDDEKKK